ncbi:hypothetical protein [Nocardia pneumoniae]|uniref:hypothetical protein n=1 Tax=Nocardia pneumoniae TaxID=228601 RepID=UPI0002DAFBC1|nr:hypothetical protein [Nocardia pneumoniae]
MGYFADRVVAITEAGSGIGRELAVALSGMGAWLALSDKSAEAVARISPVAAARTILRGDAKVLAGLDAIVVDLVTRIAGQCHERVLDMVFRS